MSLYIVIGAALMAGLIIGIITTYNAGVRSGQETGWYLGWNDCNNDHISRGTLTPDQVQDSKDPNRKWEYK